MVVVLGGVGGYLMLHYHHGNDDDWRTMLEMETFGWFGGVVVGEWGRGSWRGAWVGVCGRWGIECVCMRL